MVDQDQKPKWHVSTKLRGNARALRRDMTDAERTIWHNVRAHRFDGASFRRQTPVGPYVVDFMCHAAKLIVELDGGQHFEDVNIGRDSRRDAYLAAQGYRVLRFSNLDVMTNLSGVLETIAAALTNSRAPSLTLPRKRGRGLGGAGGEESQ
jgi:very-short-patch-repair endonuclease